MGSKRRNGVDLAVMLLRALAEKDHGWRATDLAARIGAPSTSFHRIASLLAAEGLIVRLAGNILPGPACDAFLRAHLDCLARGEHEHHYRFRKPDAALWRQPVDPQVPLALSAPPLQRARAAQFHIGFSNAAMDNPWRTALVHSIEHAVSERIGDVARLSVCHADNSAEQQAWDIDALVAEGVHGLIVSAVAGEAAYEAIDRASSKGVAVVLVDRGVPSWVDHQSFITADDAFIGRITALWLAETLGGQGDILLLPGLEGAGPAVRRLEAAQQVFAAFPYLRQIDTAWTSWHEDRAYAIVSKLIAGRAGAIDGVWCDSGTQSMGSMKAFRDAGVARGCIPPHTGGDLNGHLKLALRLNVRLAAVNYPPAMGIAALDVLLRSLKGERVLKSVTIPSEIIMSAGAATSSVQPDLSVEEYVRQDLPDDLILSAGLGRAYNPRAFRVHYPGNLYNRSAAGRCT